MEKMTITEALSEINLVKKKIETKKKTVLSLLVKAEHQKDIYESEGGAPKFVAKELQSIEDLQIRLMKIRGTISAANIENFITVGERKHSIHDWLTWKREISKDETAFLNNMVTMTKQNLDQFTKNPQCYEDKDGKKQLVVIQSNVDLPALTRKQEQLSELFEKLDGQLSLKNATIVVTV